ncbi:hsdM N-terminal domain protein [Acinetobacter sp. AR_0276]|nr:hsdM N-terminal domain protein [Acinetobacter sp. AR_0276]
MSLQQLQKQLWNIANMLRSSMVVNEFRDDILVVIFFKYLSESGELCR